MTLPESDSSIRNRRSSWTTDSTRSLQTKQTTGRYNLYQHQPQHLGMATTNEAWTDSLEKVERNDTMDVHPTEQYHTHHSTRTMARILLPRLRMGMAHPRTHKNPVPPPSARMVRIPNTAPTPQQLVIQPTPGTQSTNPSRHDPSHTENQQKLHSYRTTHSANNSSRPGSSHSRTHSISTDHNPVNHMGPTVMGSDTQTRTYCNTTRCVTRRQTNNHSERCNSRSPGPRSMRLGYMVPNAPMERRRARTRRTNRHVLRSSGGIRSIPQHPIPKQIRHPIPNHIPPQRQSYSVSR